MIEKIDGLSFKREFDCNGRNDSQYIEITKDGVEIELDTIGWESIRDAHELLFGSSLIELIKTEDQKPNNNEEVLIYSVEHKDWAIMTYEESNSGDYHSFVEDGEIYYPEFWARLKTPNQS